MKVLKVCTKQEKNGKTFWPEIGMTIFIKDDGKVSLYDQRTEKYYPCFENKKKEGDAVKEAFDGEDTPF